MVNALEAETLTAGAICALVKDAGDKLNATKERGRRDAWIFRHVLGASAETNQRMWRFLKDVRTCPPEIIAYCRKVLEPRVQSVQERRRTLVKPSMFEMRPIISRRGCPSYSPNFDKFFIYAKSGGGELLFAQRSALARIRYR